MLVEQTPTPFFDYLSKRWMNVPDPLSPINPLSLRFFPQKEWASSEMKALLSSASLGCSALFFQLFSTFFLSEQGSVPLFALTVLLLGLSQSEDLDEPPLHQLCTLPSAH